MTVRNGYEAQKRRPCQFSRRRYPGASRNEAALSSTVSTRPFLGRIAASLIAGFVPPLLLIGILAYRSWGNEPLGLCYRVPGTGGTLPIRMSPAEGVFTCGLHWDYVALNIGLPALALSLVAWWVLGLLRR